MRVSGRVKLVFGLFGKMKKMTRLYESDRYEVIETRNIQSKCDWVIRFVRPKRLFDSIEMIVPFGFCWHFSWIKHLKDTKIPISYKYIYWYCQRAWQIAMPKTKQCHSFRVWFCLSMDFVHSLYHCSPSKCVHLSDSTHKSHFNHISQMRNIVHEFAERVRVHQPEFVHREYFLLNFTWAVYTEYTMYTSINCVDSVKTIKYRRLNVVKVSHSALPYFSGNLTKWYLSTVNSNQFNEMYVNIYEPCDGSTQITIICSIEDRKKKTIETGKCQ